MSAGAAPPGPLRCPRCAAEVGPDQDWCLECGAPARTRLAATPNWRLPTVSLAAVVVVAGAVLAFAFASLTDDDGSVAPQGTAPIEAEQGAGAAPTVPPGTTAPPPAATAPPPAAAPPPGATAPPPATEAPPAAAAPPPAATQPPATPAPPQAPGTPP